MSDNISSLRDIVVSASGLFSTLVVVGVLGYVETQYGLALYSFMMFFVIPVGALVTGLAAASGYYLGAKLMHQKPAGGILLNMLLASIGAYFLVNYIPYYVMEVEGIRVKEFISFWNYLDLSIKNTSITIAMRGHDVGETGELGSAWGYAYAVLQILGFAFGGIAVFGFLTDNPYCKTCSKYLKKAGVQTRYMNDSQRLIEGIQSFASFIVNGNCNGGIEFHSNGMGENKHSSHHLCSKITIHECPSCGVNRLHFVASKLSGDSWSDVEETRIIELTNEKLTLA